MMTNLFQVSRRQFLKRSFAFSAAAALAGCGSGVRNEYDPVEGGVNHFLMVGDWGTAMTYTDQASVAQAMQAYVTRYKISTDALLMLGDNFYGEMPGGVSSPRWQSQFEQLYPSGSFPGPAFAAVGNHDYQFAPSSKVDVQLAYAAQGNTRWTLPSLYYTFKFPLRNPSVTFIVLNSNMPNELSQPIPPNPSYYTQTDAERRAQLSWLHDRLAEPLTTPYRIVLAHHPLFSNGPHGDNQTLIRDWSPLFKKYNVNLYLAGHDHDLQHLEIAGHPTSFVTSGGGGAELNNLRESDGERGPFAQKVHGFTHLQVRAQNIIVRHIDTQGRLLHKFTKTASGTVQVTA